MLANSADPDEMQRDSAFHQGLHCLLKFPFKGFQYTKGLMFLTALPTKSDSDELFWLQLLSETLTCTLHFCWRESIDHLCLNPILRITAGVIYRF